MLQPQLIRFGEIPFASMARPHDLLLIGRSEVVIPACAAAINLENGLGWQCRSFRDLEVRLTVTRTRSRLYIDSLAGRLSGAVPVADQH
jgi:hypothetical protein